MSESRLSEDGGDATLIGRIHDALADTQDTIRAFDIKAEILAAGVALVVGLINGRVMKTAEQVLVVRMLVGIGLLGVIGTVIFSGLVLWPRRGTVGQADKGVAEPHNSAGVYYVTNGTFASLLDYARAARTVDWVTEMSREILKCSHIREEKAKWFRCALICALIAVLPTSVAAIWSLETTSRPALENNTREMLSHNRANSPSRYSIGGSHMWSDRSFDQLPVNGP